jgi:hypothetical protein
LHFGKKKPDTLTSGEGVELTTSLINNTPIEMEVQAFQKSRHGKDTSCLTNTYWQGFMRRHTQPLERGYGTGWLPPFFVQK